MRKRARFSPSCVDDLVERVEPLLGLVLVDVGQLVLELVEVHGAGRLPRGDGPRGRCGRPEGTVIAFGRTVPQPWPGAGHGAAGHRRPARRGRPQRIPCILPLDPTGSAHRTASRTPGWAAGRGVRAGTSSDRGTNHPRRRAGVSRIDRRRPGPGGRRTGARNRPRQRAAGRPNRAARPAARRPTRSAARA